jgi:hypothetical protein
MPARPPDQPGSPSPTEHAPAPQAAPAPQGGQGKPHRSRRGCPRPPAEPSPLPDPAAVHLCLIPDSAPPYDAPSEAPCGAGSRPPGHEPPGHEPPGASGTVRDPGDGDAGQRRPGGRAPRQPDDPALTGRPDSVAGRPGWPSHFAQVLAETLAGSRPPRQMVPWTTERALTRIRRLGPQLSGGQHPRVRRVVTFHPTPDVIEMSVVVGFGSRVRALAVRLERDRPAGARAGLAGQPGRWLCTTVEAA